MSAAYKELNSLIGNYSFNGTQCNISSLYAACEGELIK